MLHKYFSRFSAVLMTVVLLFFVGCSTPQGQNEPVNIYQKWQSSDNEIFEITETDFKNLYNGTVFYGGNNLEVIPDTQDSGTIFFKYTKAYKNDDEGKWYAVRYKNLTKTSVSISGAGKEGGKTSAQTLEEAEKEFTKENGYFESFSECSVAD